MEAITAAEAVIIYGNHYCSQSRHYIWKPLLQPKLSLYMETTIAAKANIIMEAFIVIRIRIERQNKAYKPFAIK